MVISKGTCGVLAAGLFLAGFAFHDVIRPARAEAQTANRVFELRTYTAPPGKLEALHTRFRDHTLRLFTKHGITNIGYWTPADAPLAENTLVYLIAYPSRDAAKKSWGAFRSDPDWIKARDESQKDGSLTTKVESVFLNPTDYSPLK